MLIIEDAKVLGTFKHKVRKDKTLEDKNQYIEDAWHCVTNMTVVFIINIKLGDNVIKKRKK